MSAQTERVLIVGRSSSVLVDAVKILRDRGFGANASNQSDTLLDDYDMREVDLVIFGGMVLPEKKERLQAAIRMLNPQMRFMPGLGGIAPLLVAQVEEHFGGGTDGVEYDADARAFRVTLPASAPVRVEALWATFVPPELVGHSVVAFDSELAAGDHKIVIPDEVPLLGSYAIVRSKGHVSAFQIGKTPAPIKRIAAAQALPAPEPVTTQFPWG